MERCSNTALFMEKFCPLLESGEELALPVQGSSMVPFLVDRRDTVWLRKPDGVLKTGDIVLYRRSNGQYILHRIHSIQSGSYTMVGDAHQVLEPGIRREQILGRVTCVYRKEKTVGPGSFCWQFFARVWIHMVPLRGAAMRLYSGIKNIFGRKK